MHEARFRKPLLFILSQWTTKVRWISSSLPLTAGHKTQAGRKVKAAFPPEFHGKLKEWPLLVEAEIQANTGNIKSLVEAGNWDEIRGRGMGTEKLRIVEDTVDPLHGRHIVFELPRVKDQDLKPISGLFRRGVPVDVCAGDKFHRIAEGIVTNFDRPTGAVSLKLVGSQAGKAELYQDSEYSLLQSFSRGSLHSLKEYVEEIAKLDPSSAKKLPGMDLLAYAFRGKMMPVIHSDRKIHATGNLDESQQRCVNAALNKKRPFVVIQGPPGTGKTRTVAEIIVQLVRKNQRVLVCSPTNAALLNCMQSLTDSGEATNSMLMNTDASLILNDEIVNHEKYEDLHLLVKLKENSGKGGREVWELRHGIVKDILSKKSVIFCTTASSMCHRILKYGWIPDVVIIDEAGQCTESGSWMPLLSGRRCILAGDHQQLPAVIVSEKARSAGFNISLMERLATEFKNSSISFLLDTQYRMNEKIMRWSSESFYEGRLKAGTAVKEITLSEISDIPPDSLLDSPLIAIDTRLMNSHEQRVNTSLKNIGEQHVIVDYVRKLIGCGVRGEDIGVITPYFAQMKELTESLDRLNVEVNTVDGFQGREKQVIVFGLCRDNRRGFVGFVDDHRRLNVAVTRAKRQFVFVGNKKMMGANDILKSLWEFISKEGRVIHAHVLEKTFRRKLHETKDLEAQGQKKKYSSAASA